VRDGQLKAAALLRLGATVSVGDSLLRDLIQAACQLPLHGKKPSGVCRFVYLVRQESQARQTGKLRAIAASNRLKD
jgi:hypothetical protein